MNDRDLTRLLDDAANAFEPTPSPGRLALALAPSRARGRRLYMVVGIAAGLTALGAGAAAMTGAETAIRTPADGFEVDVTIERGKVVPKPTTLTEHEQQARDHKRPTRPKVALAPDTSDDGDEGTAGDTADAVETRRLELAALNFVPVAEPKVTAEPEPQHEHPPTTTEHVHDDPPPTTTEHGHEDPPPPATTEPPHEDPPPPATTEPPHEDPPADDPPPPSIEFTAHQQWGSCSIDPPYDEFSGTATPATGISIFSPYGSGYTEANGKGHWYLKVVFATAPVGEHFTVTLETSQGHSETFSFVRTG
jgi:hypothetical protein